MHARVKLPTALDELVPRWQAALMAKRAAEHK